MDKTESINLKISQTNILKTVTVIFLSVCFSYSQTTQTSETQTLLRQILLHYQQGDFDKAIPLAEKVLIIEKNNTKRTPQSLATAHYNVALLRKKRFQLNNKIIGKDIADKNLRTKHFKLLDEDGKESEKQFREVIEIHKKIEKPSLQDSLQLASTKNELAWLLYNYRRLWTVSLLGYSKQGRFKEAEDLYGSAVKINEKLLGRDANKTLSTIFNFAEFYRRHANFEKSLPLFERFVSTFKKKHGENNKTLLPSLYSMAEIFVAVDKVEKARKVMDLISKIKQSEENLPEANYVLNWRLIKGKMGREDRSFNNYGLGRPLYSKSSRIKKVTVKILVDESGNVIESNAISDQDKLKTEAEKNVKEWKFRPFELNGEKSKMRGYAIYSKIFIK